ncbi:MAG: putative transcriptional regulator, ArsR family [Rhodocyclales bacterium]|nr:putative transcriptional regulator, ArsR family [Rhodocyclales bacterium]
MANHISTDDESASAMDEIIKALASPARREILGWLKNPAQQFPAQAYPFELGVCACNIYAKVGLSQSTVSAHLACLRRAGLVSTHKVGQWIFYSRNEAVIGAFLRQMQQEL